MIFELIFDASKEMGRVHSEQNSDYRVFLLYTLVRNIEIISRKRFMTSKIKSCF